MLQLPWPGCFPSKQKDSGKKSITFKARGVYGKGFGVRVCFGVLLLYDTPGKGLVGKVNNGEEAWIEADSGYSKGD